jgi:hypothetical protein
MSCPLRSSNRARVNRTRLLAKPYLSIICWLLSPGWKRVVSTPFVITVIRSAGTPALGNVLFAGDTVAGIIDWEWAQENGFQQVDALYMLFGSVTTRHATLAHYCRLLWEGEIGDAALSERIAQLRTRSGMDEDDLKFIALLLWFNNLWERAMHGSMLQAPWIEDMIPRTMPAMMNWLARHKRSSESCAATS